MNRNYERGVRFERQLMADFKKEGYNVIRASGSHGLFDIVAFHFDNRHIRFIQCKVKKDKKKYGNVINTEFRLHPNMHVDTMKSTKYTR